MADQEPELVAKLQAALEDAESARRAYDAAVREESAARSCTTNALNRLNGAQHAVDELMSKFTDNMPQSSDWQSRRRLARGNTAVPRGERE